MIKLFRNISKKLLEQGKTTYYLKYAIGEIVLVVIGILIALSINNWNETRKIRNSEHEILKNLKSELIINKIELERIYNLHLNYFSSGIALLKLFNTDVSAIQDRCTVNSNKNHEKTPLTICIAIY